jgi:hypothetical protein
MNNTGITKQLKECNKAFLQQKEKIEYQKAKIADLEKEIKRLKNSDKSMRTIVLLKNQNKELQKRCKLKM